MIGTKLIAVGVGSKDYSFRPKVHKLLAEQTGGTDSLSLPESIVSNLLGDPKAAAWLRLTDRLCGICVCVSVWKPESQKKKREIESQEERKFVAAGGSGKQFEGRKKLSPEEQGLWQTRSRNRREAWGTGVGVLAGQVWHRRRKRGRQQMGRVPSSQTDAVERRFCGSHICFQPRSDAGWATA